MCTSISIFTFKAWITFFFADKPMHTAKKIQIRILDLQSWTFLKRFAAFKMQGTREMQFKFWLRRRLSFKRWNLEKGWNKNWSANVNLSLQERKISWRIILANLRWLDTVFRGQYLPSLSINYVAINKGLQKSPLQLYQIKMKISYD